MLGRKKKQLFKVLDQPPVFTQEPGESVEHLMARVQFAVSSIFETNDGKYVNMDGDGDGNLTPEEVMNALNDPILKNVVPKTERKEILRLAKKAKKEKRPVISIGELTSHMHQTFAVTMNDGSKVLLERGTPHEKYKQVLSDEQFDELDVDSNNRITVGEYHYNIMMNRNQPTAPVEPAVPDNKKNS